MDRKALSWGVVAVVCIALTVFVFTVWPLQWQYFNVGATVIQVHRRTGQVYLVRAEERDYTGEAHGQTADQMLEGALRSERAKRFLEATERPER